MQLWSKLGPILEFCPEQIRTHLATSTIKRIGILTYFEKKIKQSKLRSCRLINVQVSIDSVFLKKGDCQLPNCIRKRTLEVHCTTKLSPSILRPVFIRKHTIRGQTPMIFPTTSTREGIDGGARTQQQVSQHDEMPSSPCAQRPSV